MLWQRIKKVGSNLAADKVRGELFYGWVTAIAGAGVIFAAGSFQYNFGIFVKPLIDKFGWTRATISSIISVRSLVLALLFPIVGTWSDRYGARRLILVGVFLGGLGYLLAFPASSLWHLYFAFSLLTGAGVALTLTPVLAAVTRWFGGKSSLASGIVYSGFSTAQILLPPAVTYLFVQYGWETSLIVLGVAAWLLGTLFWSFIKSPPSGSPNQPPVQAVNTNEANKLQTPAGNGYTLSEALRTSSFWFMFLVYAINALSFQMVIVHIVVAAIDIGITAGAAAIILTITGVTNTLGRLTLGGLADKIGIRTVLALSLALQVPTLFVLAGDSDLGTFYLIGAVYGFLYGGIVPTMPTLAGSFFGIKAIGAIIGTLTVVHVVGTAIGPLLAGYIFDITGSYSIAFSTAAIAVAVACLLCLMLKPPKKKVLAT